MGEKLNLRGSQLAMESSEKVVAALRSCAARANSDGAPELHELHEATLECVRDEKRRKELLLQLLQCMISLPKENRLVMQAARLMWALGTSNMGIDVIVKEPPKPPSDGQPEIGVLLLGFAGASMGMLTLHVRTYQEMNPGWRVVTTTGSLLHLLDANDAAKARAEQLLQEQIDEIARGLAGCKRVLVHSMSNNGQVLWASLLVKLPHVVERVSAMVLDCGACPAEHYPQENLHQVLVQTVLASAFLNQLPWVAPPGRFGEKQLKNLVDGPLAHALEAGEVILMPSSDASDASDAVSEDSCALQVRLDPPVPTLVLTSSQDEVVPEAGVRAFAQQLVEAQPKRQVRVESLRGAHVRLLQTSSAPFRAHLQQLFEQAGLVAAAEAAAPRLAGDISDPAPAAAPTAATPPTAAPDLAALDPKAQSLLRRLGRLANGSGPPLGSRECENALALAQRAATEPGLLAVMASVLLPIVSDVAPLGGKTGTMPLLKLVISCLFRLSTADDAPIALREGAVASVTGTDDGGAPAVGVLILGKGESSASLLASIDDFYRLQRPGWQVARAVTLGGAGSGVLDEATLAAQAERFGAALAESKSPVVDALCVGDLAKVLLVSL